MNNLLLARERSPRLGRGWSKALIALALALLITGSALARDALSPQEAPDLFFDSVYRMDYVQAWQILSGASQERILKLVLETEKDPRLQPAALRKLFESGDRAVQRGFWTQLRQSMDIEAWNQQNFTEVRAGGKPGESFVRVMPADIYVFVRQENQGWKFGFAESFVERRRPDGVAAPTQPSPMPAKSQNTGQNTGGAQR
ncbi:MAG: hypothetical protein CVV27_10445 [Candidatus Melainabacteria bacterium HGW-Melainabacteria-1]|nr:MAG: hypothetical protein CVV27_10445 [Candidatus Melainabacteria bacterium HGW-Melainabacteria-1]